MFTDTYESLIAEDATLLMELLRGSRCAGMTACVCLYTAVYPP